MKQLRLKRKIYILLTYAKPSLPNELIETIICYTGIVFNVWDYLYEKYPNDPEWTKYDLNRNLSLDMLCKTSTLNNIVFLLHNKHITHEQIIGDNRLLWDFSILTYNKYLNCEIVEKFIDNSWDFDTLSYMKYITNSFIIKHQDKPWAKKIKDYVTVMKSTKFKFPFIDYVKQNSDRIQNWNKVSCHSSIKWDDIKNNPTLPWNPKYVSLNKNITCHIVTTNPDYPWDWDSLARNPSIIWQDKKKYSHQRIYISDHNPNITLDAIIEQSDITFNKINILNSKMTNSDKVKAFHLLQNRGDK